MSTNSNVSVITNLAYTLAKNCTISENSLQNGLFTPQNDISQALEQIPLVSLSGKLSSTTKETDAGELTTLTLTGKVAKINAANNAMLRKLKHGAYAYVATDFEGILYLIGNNEIQTDFAYQTDVGNITGFRGYQFTITLTWQHGLVIAQ